MAGTALPGAAPFGRVGERVARLYTLDNGTLRVSITDYAGAVVSIEAPDRGGRRNHVVLGFDDAAGYAAADGSFGALLGRDANRIADGRLTIDGVTYSLSTNENGSTLHGGAQGFDKQFWSVAAAEPTRLVLTLTSPDGDQGFPGEVRARATYSLDGPRLSLVLEARTTRPTSLSLSAHPYFNLDGPGMSHCLDHEVALFSSGFLPTDQRQIPLGLICPVEGTPFDFLAPQRIGARIDDTDRQLQHGRGYDHYYVLEPGNALRLAARVRAPISGRVLEVWTTQRGLQFYSGNNLDGSLAGRGGLYRQSAGFALEPQGFPDAPNQPNFPSSILRPGELYREQIVYRFLTDAGDVPCAQVGA